MAIRPTSTGLRKLGCIPLRNTLLGRAAAGRGPISWEQLDLWYARKKREEEDARKNKEEADARKRVEEKSIQQTDVKADWGRDGTWRMVQGAIFCLFMTVVGIWQKDAVSFWVGLMMFFFCMLFLAIGFFE